MGAAVYVRDTGCTRDARCTGDAVYVRAVPRACAARRCSISPTGDKGGGLSPGAGTAAHAGGFGAGGSLCPRHRRRVGFLCSRRRAGSPPPRLPTGPGSERPPRSKSAAFAYSEQVGAHMPKMHQTKLATIIIIKCAVARGGRESLADKPDNYEAQHVRSGFATIMPSSASRQ